jgi:hypothetical protein
MRMHDALAEREESREQQEDVQLTTTTTTSINISIQKGAFSYKRYFIDTQNTKLLFSSEQKENVFLRLSQRTYVNIHPFVQLSFYKTINRVE